MTTQNAIDLADYFLKKENFYYFCLGRFTQDAIENSFSVIRSIQPVPSAKEFKTAVKLISISQYNRTNRKGNYQISDAEYLANFLNKNSEIYEEDENEASLLNVTLDFSYNTEHDEIQSLYYLAGRTVYQVIKINKIKCSTCMNDIKTEEDDPQISSLINLTKLKALSNKITFASKGVFDILQEAEKYFRQFETCLLKGETKLKLILHSFMNTSTYKTNFVVCHDIAMKVVSMY